jgi:hypothetical protein
LNTESYNVLINSERVQGTAKSIGAHASIVEYSKDGIYYQEMIENEDLTFMEEE